MIIWFMGAPASGKTTLSHAVQRELAGVRRSAVVLDGDVIRDSLCADLGFSSADRQENTRRVIHVADMLQKQGVTVLVALITPERQMQTLVRQLLPTALLVHCKAPLAVLEERDPKGHYKEARLGLRPGFTGVDAPYETPEVADLVIDTSGAQSVVDCVEDVLKNSIYKIVDLL